MQFGLRWGLASGIIAVLATGLFGVGVGAAEETNDLRVMTFNLRYGTANDGENRWENRKEFLLETVQAFDPDLLGTQETLAFQRDFLKERLSGYAAIGIGRDDGTEKGEMTAVFYKEDRFERLGGGHFWLSETPDVVGSKGWDTSLPRMATWVKLRDRRDENAKPILFINTHFDHRGPVAREESARLMRRKAVELGEGCSIIVTGDFNAGEGSKPYNALFGAADGEPSPVVDAFREANPDATDNEGTATGFQADRTTGARIDWIALSRDWTIKASRINHASRDGRTPSDHFPVEAVIER